MKHDELELVLSANHDVRAGYKMAINECYLMISKDVAEFYRAATNCNKNSKLYHEFISTARLLEKYLNKLNLDLSIK